MKTQTYYKQSIGVLMFLILSTMAFSSEIDIYFFSSNARLVDFMLHGSSTTQSLPMTQQENGLWHVQVEHSGNFSYQFRVTRHQGQMVYSDPYLPSEDGPRSPSRFFQTEADQYERSGNRIKSPGDLDSAASENFELFVSGNAERRIIEYERHYEQLLTIIERLGLRPHPAAGKIRYYAFSHPYDSPWFAYYNSSEIWDAHDVISTHEMMHTLFSFRIPALDEGIAQLFQKEGNSTYLDQNINRISALRLSQGQLPPIQQIVTNFDYSFDQYRHAASFYYWHLFVDDAQRRTSFLNFLREMHERKNAKHIGELYSRYMGQHIDQSDQAWRQWLQKLSPPYPVVPGWEDF